MVKDKLNVLCVLVVVGRIVYHVLVAGVKSAFNVEALDILILRREYSALFALDEVIKIVQVALDGDMKIVFPATDLDMKIVMNAMG